MTKYFVCINQPNSGQVNVPGSREEMACNIAMVASQFEKPKDFYIAYHSSNPQSTWEALKETAKYSVEIDDERAELWEKEFFPLTELSTAINDAIGEAYSAIVEAAQAFDQACAKSRNFGNYQVLENIGLNAAFDILENFSYEEISEKVDEIYEVTSLNSH
jgi:hypothetical protein